MAKTTAARMRIRFYDKPVLSTKTIFQQNHFRWWCLAHVTGARPVALVFHFRFLKYLCCTLVCNAMFCSVVLFSEYVSILTFVCWNSYVCFCHWWDSSFLFFFVLWTVYSEFYMPTLNTRWNKRTKYMKFGVNHTEKKLNQAQYDRQWAKAKKNMAIWRCEINNGNDASSKAKKSALRIKRNENSSFIVEIYFIPDKFSLILCYSCTNDMISVRPFIAIFFKLFECTEFREWAKKSRLPSNITGTIRVMSIFSRCIQSIFFLAQLQSTLFRALSF